MEAKSIERIAEELGVNFYDLHPLISARDNFIKQEGRREVVEWGNESCPHIKEFLKRDCDLCRQAKLKEWGLDNELER